MILIKTWPALALVPLVLVASTTNDEDDRRFLSQRARSSGLAAGWTHAVDPKPLTRHVDLGLAWLVAHQHPGGGWGQGDESLRMGGGAQLPRGAPNVGDTATAALALLRAGHTPMSGEYSDNLRAAVRYVAAEISASDPDSLRVTSAQGTRLQSKIGPYVDTFLASMFLSEVVLVMQGDDDQQLAESALATVIDKIESHQRDDGTWDDRGWAPVLSQSIAAKGLNRAAQGGQFVDEDVLALSLGYASSRVDDDGLRTRGEGSAGVELYMAGTIVSTLQDSLNSSEARQRRLRQELAAAPDDEAAAAVERELDALGKKLEDTRAKNQVAQRSLVQRLGDDRFVSGFGSNGGEEFLSYMNISESLVMTGGDEWLQWDGKMTNNLNRIQNQDGSWSGHHCITGRTFCTAAALLVLMADRTPVPAETPLHDPASHVDGQSACDDCPQVSAIDGEDSDG